MLKHLCAKWSMGGFGIKSAVSLSSVQLELIQSLIIPDPHSGMLIDRGAIEALVMAFMGKSENNQQFAVHL